MNSSQALAGGIHPSAPKTFVSLYSGFGGADIGAKAAGLETIGGVEWDERIVEVAHRNHLSEIVCANVGSMSHKNYGADWLHASPPCPNFSVAKRGGGENATDYGNANAVLETIRVNLPKYVSIENVRAYRDSQSMEVIRKGLAKFGYHVVEGFLNAADYGVPQTRTRYFLIASNVRTPIFPRKTHSENPTLSLFDGNLHGQRRWVSWYDSISDLVSDLPDAKIADWQYKRLSPEWKAALIKGQRDKEDNLYYVVAPDAPAGKVTAQTGQTRAALLSSQTASGGTKLAKRHSDQPAMTIIVNSDRQRAIVCATQSRSDALPRDESSPMHTVTAQRYRPKAVIVDNRNADRTLTSRLEHEPVNTITVARSTRDLHTVIDNQSVRVVRISPRCLARFQSFPDSYRLPESVTLACRGIGNAVPPLLMQRIIEANSRYGY